LWPIYWFSLVNPPGYLVRNESRLFAYKSHTEPFYFLELLQ
jgi:hypothetical protein